MSSYDKYFFKHKYCKSRNKGNYDKNIAENVCKSNKTDFNLKNDKKNMKN